MSTFIRRKRTGQAWETVSDGGPQTLPVYASEQAAAAALSPGQWMVYATPQGGGVILAKAANGTTVSGLVFEG